MERELKSPILYESKEKDFNKATGIPQYRGGIRFSMNIMTVCYKKKKKDEILLIQKKKETIREENITQETQGKSLQMLFTLEQLGLNKIKD